MPMMKQSLKSVRQQPMIVHQSDETSISSRTQLRAKDNKTQQSSEQRNERTKE